MIKSLEANKFLKSDNFCRILKKSVVYWDTSLDSFSCTIHFYGFIHKSIANWILIVVFLKFCSFWITLWTEMGKSKLKNFPKPMHHFVVSRHSAWTIFSMKWMGKANTLWIKLPTIKYTLNKTVRNDRGMCVKNPFVYLCKQQLIN